MDVTSDNVKTYCQTFFRYLVTTPCLTIGYVGKKDFRKTVRFDEDSLGFLNRYAGGLEDRETRGGGDGFSDAVRIAVTALRAAVEKRTDEDAKALSAYYGVKAAGESVLHDWVALGAGLTEHPETAGVVRAALEMQRGAPSRTKIGAAPRKRSVLRRGRRASGGRG